MRSRNLQEVVVAIRCPICHAAVGFDGNVATCRGQQCRARYPITDGVPILINEANSVFLISDFELGRETTFKSQSLYKRLANRLLPANSLNVSSRDNYKAFLKAVKYANAAPKVLIIGGGVVGDGCEVLLADPDVKVVSTDVSHGGGVAIICDAHDLPFEDQTFDGVVAQAVLEHVLDPVRCVSEIHRVLKQEGVVYAETPFMQQVHMGRYDFTRFTYLGHRRLFRWFTEVDSGVACGPGMALSWAYEYFLISFTEMPVLRGALRAFARLTSFPLKYFDYALSRRPGGFDAASGFWFIGKKSARCLSDRKLVGLYRGAQ